MKNLSLLFIAFLLLQFTTLAQEGWFEQTSGTTHNLNSVYFVDNNTGWAVGDSGKILNTTDGGTNWIPQTIDTMFSLYSVHFEDNNTGWTVGWDYDLDVGVILKTTDGGTNWNYQTIDPNVYLSVYFTDNNTGWAVGSGGTILNTTDGGTNWNPQTSGTWFVLRSVYFIDNDTGWAAGGFWDWGGGILKTTNGGNNWTSQIGTVESLSSVYFIDNNTGWAVGYEHYSGGVILKTTDGGTNWDYQTIDSTVISSVYFTDQDTGWAVGSNGKILNTINGGANWNPQTSGTTMFLRSIHFVDNNTGWAVGVNGTILKTTNGGIIPVELTSFTAIAQSDYVELNWSTATETNNSGFEIERRQDSEWERIDFVEGHGTTTESQQYFFVDDIRDVTATSIAYRLKQLDFDGSFEYSDEVFVENIALSDFALHQNFPNPFNPSTKIRFSVPQSSNVIIKVFDILGNEIETLVNEEKPIGIYELTWYAEQLPSGIYFYRLQAGSFVETKKMVLLK